MIDGGCQIDHLNCGDENLLIDSAPYLSVQVC